MRPDQINLLLHGFASPNFIIPDVQAAIPYLEAILKMTEPCWTGQPRHGIGQSSNGTCLLSRWRNLMSVADRSCALTVCLTYKLVRYN